MGNAGIKVTQLIEGEQGLNFAGQCDVLNYNISFLLLPFSFFLIFLFTVVTVNLEMSQSSPLKSDSCVSALPILMYSLMLEFLTLQHQL